MVLASLLTFISGLFARLHSNDIAFGGKNVIVVALVQLPPVRAIYHQSGIIIFTTVPKDPNFINSWKKSDLETFPHIHGPESKRIHATLDILLASTHIVGLLEAADQINRIIRTVLPIDNEKFFFIVEGVQISTEETQPEFNLPSDVRLQQGTRVIFLNNTLITIGICNGTIGVITDLDKNTQTVQVYMKQLYIGQSLNKPSISMLMDNKLHERNSDYKILRS